ncbi:MAG: spore maturation protein, partial [Peptostreptococcales bacterium]
MQIANTLSYSIMPLMITLILLFGVKERINVYDAFIEGAKTGIQTAMKIMPYMIAIFLVISLFRQSETLGILERLLNPIFDKIGFPKELFSMLLIKP